MASLLQVQDSPRIHGLPCQQNKKEKLVPQTKKYIYLQELCISTKLKMFDNNSSDHTFTTTATATCTQFYGIIKVTCEHLKMTTEPYFYLQCRFLI